ncbi:alcohol dehydrogenase [Talaromyces proteolyticus]|uniref:Alcohol dehydrogenase n=1 Tax=Talaromyces proteolyticus TaxID=1131652 RepID=A0AAD4L128_9EURO|nr:alcohol dehydrogenase [Talaromyces proteolyticus]KAH8700949.1 alcohol dehydrogenase [Talaromyces proteolyticus]
MSLPKSFKQATFTHSGGPLIIQETDIVNPGPGEILVKVEACGVCYSDTVAQNNLAGRGFPLVPGHEIIGRAAAIGDGVSGWNLGDRIGGGWHGGHDGTCAACKRGLYQMCDHQEINGISKDGGYAEYCLLRAEAAVRVPAHVDAAEYAPILCAGVTVFTSIRQMNIAPGAMVAIQGLGGLGHLAIQYANRFGYRVVAMSRGRQKEAFARQLGAHEYIDTSKENAGESLQRLGRASLIVCTAPSVEVISPLMKGLDMLGKLLILSDIGDVPVNTGGMIRYGLSVQSWPSGHAMNSEDAIKFTELQNINCMIERFPLEKANEAYEAMLNGSVRFRAVLTME